MREWRCGGQSALRRFSRGIGRLWNVTQARTILGIKVVLPILRSLDEGESVLCCVHSVGYGLQGTENIIGLPSRGTIIVGNGGSGKAELVDGKDEDEMGEKRIRERVARLWMHVRFGGQNGDGHC